MVREFPYANLHDLNIDWILKIIKEFHEKFENLDETFQNMLDEIDAKGQEAILALQGEKDTAIASIQEFLNTCIADLTLYKNDAIAAVNEVGLNQKLLVIQEGTNALNALSAMLSNVPSTYEDALNQLQIINSILNLDYTYPPLTQGYYMLDEDDNETISLQTSVSMVSTMLTSGCAGRTLNITIATGTAIIQYIRYFTGWDDDKTQTTVQISTSSSAKTSYQYKFPDDVSYATILFTYDYDASQQLTPNDFTVDLKWSTPLSNLIYSFKDSIAIQDERTNKLFGLINYGYDTPEELEAGTSAATRLSVKRYTERILLNGTTSNSGYCIIKINNDLQRKSTNSQIDTFTNGTVLPSGHTYRLRIKEISGTYTDADSQPTHPSMVAYKRGAHSQVGSYIQDPNYTSTYEFTSDGSEYIICVWNNYSRTATNYLMEVTMQDMADKSIYELIPDEAISNMPAYSSPLGTALTYRTPNNAPLGNAYVHDITTTDSVDANITQGICSDGNRFLYWNIAPMGNNLGREVNQRIRKWDTWLNESAGLSNAGDWGHCEDICYIPEWAPMFDNGNVNRIYATDFNYSVEHPSGDYIHVFNADTLEYITSFPTLYADSGIAPDGWRGALRLTFSKERGLFCLMSGKTDENDVVWWAFFIYDSNGTLLRGAKVKKSAGTATGIDCDENYIYFMRYATIGGTVRIYTYVIDWNLNPIAKYEVTKADWEIEGMTHIGNDVYYSYNQSAGANRKNTIQKTSLIYDYHSATDIPPFNWSTSDGLNVSTWEHLNV